MAQLGARLNGIEKVAGSSPAGSTFYPFSVQKMYHQARFTVLQRYPNEQENYLKSRDN